MLSHVVEQAKTSPKIDTIMTDIKSYEFLKTITTPTANKVHTATDKVVAVITGKAFFNLKIDIILFSSVLVFCSLSALHLGLGENTPQTHSALAQPLNYSTFERLNISAKLRVQAARLGP